MENAKNFILRLKFPFNLVKENRVLMANPGDAPAEKAGITSAPEPVPEKKLRKPDEIQKDLDDIDAKEKNLAELKAAPKETDKEKLRLQDEAIATLEKEVQELQKKKIDLKSEKLESDAQFEKDKQAEQKKTKEDMEALKSDLDAGQKKFFEGLVGGLGNTNLAVLRDKHSINAETWDITSKSGLDVVKDHWAKLELYNKENPDPFFKNIFEQLEKLSDPKEFGEIKPEDGNSYSSVDEKKKIYLAPEANKNKIANPGIQKAVSFFMAIKERMKVQDMFEQQTTEMQQEKGQDKIAATGIKFVTDNVKKFQDAIRQKDWGTALVYVVGVYVAYKGAMKIWEKTPEFAKTGIYAASFLYVANMFAKNAGYDPLKALGFKGTDAEVRGSPLEKFYNLNVAGSEKMDGAVLRDLAYTNVLDLNSLFNETNEKGIDFIDPNALIPSPFGDQFRGMSPSVLHKTGALTSKEQEYKRVGQQIYLIAKVVRDSYDMHIKPKNNGLTLEEALNKTPSLKDATLMKFAMAFESVAGRERGILSGGKLGEALGLNFASYRMRKRFEEVFKDKGMGFDATHTPIAPGVYKAQVMDFPVVIREDSTTKKYTVFSLYDYEKAKGSPDALTQALTEIPFEGNANDQADKLKQSIIGKFKDVVVEVNKSASKDLKLGDITYKDGKFVTDLKVMPNSLLGTAKTMKVFLKVSKDGSTVEVYEENGELLLNLDSSGDTKKLYGNLVMAGLGQQADMSPFFFLYKAKKLEFKGQNNDPEKSFTVIAGDNKVEIRFKLDAKTGKYVLAKGEEKKIFSESNYPFLREIAENAVKENKDLKEATEKFTKILYGVPEEYMVNLFQNVPNWWKGATSHKWWRGFSLDQFTGSIPKNYTKAMVDAQAEFLISGMTAEIAKGGTLDKASKAVDNKGAINDMVAKLEEISKKLSNIEHVKKTKGEAFAAEEFRQEILSGVSNIAIKSKTYGLWYEQFSTQIFMEYGKDDLFKERTDRAGKILSVYASYTHDLDNPKLDKDQNGNMRRVDDPLYKKHAAYANYVAEGMFAKMNEGELPQEVPVQSSYWEIMTWTEFGKKYDADPSKYETSFEHVAEKEALKMSSDYIEFDAWLNNPNSKLPVSMLFRTRKAPLVFTVRKGNNADRIKLDKLKSLIGDGKNVEKMALPETFKFFHSRMQESLRELKDGGYGEPTAKFDELIDTNYATRYKVEIVDVPPDSKQITIRVNEDKKSYLYEEVEKLEAKMITAGRSLTKSEQEKMINERISEIVETTILNENIIDTYFKKGKLTDSVRNLYFKFKGWLFN